MILEINWTAITDGLLIAAVGYIVVLVSLALLYYVFRYLPDILHWQIRLRLKKQGKPESKAENLSMKGDETAAIALALYLYFNEMHDEENTAMTIRKISKTYSPWNSKIFGVMNPRWKR